jgi:predicted dehydrogenase
MKRREFIGKSLAGTTGIIAGASGILIPSCRSANDKVVLALIGAGGRGRHTIISCCQANSNVEIKTVCDVNDLNAALTVSEIEKQLGYRPQSTRNMKEVFDDRDVDAVWISTPDHWHALATIIACQAGKDVYVEKCPGHSIWEGRKMIEAARKYKQIVQVGFQNRSGKYNFAARDYIQSGKLGQVVHIRIYNLLGGKKWMPQPDTAVPQTLDWDAWLGPAPYRSFNPEILNGWLFYYDYCPGLLDDASHQLDLVRMVMGNPGHPKSVYGQGRNHVWNSEQGTPEVQSITFDFEKYTVTCDSGNVTNYMSKTPETIRMDPNRFPEWKTNSDRIEIYGSLGMMYLGRQGGGWQVYGPGEKIVAQTGGIHSDKEHQINFIECIRNRKQPNSTIDQGHMSASLVHMANIACRTGNKQLLFDGEKEMFVDNAEANKLLKDSYRTNYEVPEKV